MHQSSRKQRKVLRFRLGRPDNVIKVLLALPVFLPHPLHQPHFVSIHFPPHLLGLCVPEAAKGKAETFT